MRDDVACRTALRSSAAVEAPVVQGDNSTPYRIETRAPKSTLATIDSGGQACSLERDNDRQWRSRSRIRPQPDAQECEFARGQELTASRLEGGKRWSTYSRRLLRNLPFRVGAFSKA